MNCFNCTSQIQGETCSTCGLPQTEAVQVLHRSFRRARLKSRIFGGTLIGLFVIAFIGGLRDRHHAQDPKLAKEAAQKAKAVQPALVSDYFMRLMDSQLHLGLRSWYTRPDGSIVFEMTPPGPENPVALWEAYSPADREKIMGLIGTTYTGVLLNEGVLKDITPTTHPVIYLAYYGHNVPLAARMANGDVRIFPSPFAGQPLPSR